MKNLNRKTRRNQAAFTMLELLFTLVIIGILTSLAAGAYGAFKGKAAATEALSMVPATQLAYEAAFATINSAPLTNSAAGLLGMTEYHGNYVSSIEVNPGGVEVIFKAGLETGLAGASLVFVPYQADHGGIIWGCDGGPIPTDSFGAILTVINGIVPGAPTSVSVPFRPAICNS